MNYTATELSLFGTQGAAEPWMQPSPVKILPTLRERQSFTDFQKRQRFSFYVGLIVGGICSVALILELAVFLVNLIFRQRDASDEGYSLMTLSASLGSRVKKVKFVESREGMLDRKSNYVLLDIYFAMYFAVNQMLCAGIVVLALEHDYVDADFGLNFEMYIPWVIEALIVHVFSVIVCIWNRSTGRQRHDIASPFFLVSRSILPFFSERFNLLRDWATIGVYLNDAHPIGKVCATIVFFSLVCCVVVLFNEPKLIFSLRLNYWPMARQDMTVGAIAHELKPKTNDAYDAMVRKLDYRTTMTERRGIRESLAEFELRLMSEIDSSTRQHKMITTLFGEIPQAIACLLFVFFKRFSVFVVICLTIDLIKVFVLIFVRPYVLCMMADRKMEWKYLKANDLEGIFHSRRRFRNVCNWQRRVMNAMRLVKDMKEGPDEVAAAVRGIGYLLCEANDDESAHYQAAYTTFLRELHYDLGEDSMDHSVGVRIVKSAIEETLLELCVGVEMRDVVAKKPGAGNLGYSPTGSSLKDIQQLVDEMHKGEHDVIKLLEERRVCRYATLQHKDKGGRHDDLMIFFADCESEDLIAIAQLWQLKMEKTRMATDPIVIYGADFQSKDRGTVFEKKQLLARLLLGPRNLFVLTPDETTYKEKHKYEHPSAEYWAARRADELRAICQSVKQYKGNNVHFYIMGPGRGCIASLLEELKKEHIFPSKQKWNIKLYSGPFNIRFMTPSDLDAIRTFSTRSGKPLLDVAKFPFFGGEDAHPSTSCFTTFAPKRFPNELNMVAHELVPACFKLLNDELNFQLIEPSKLYTTKPLTRREQLRFEDIKHLYAVDTISEYCQAILDDFSLFAKVKENKKTTIAAFAHQSSDTPLETQLVFMVEFLLDKHPSYLCHTDVGSWNVEESNNTSVELKPSRNLKSTTCQAMQPILKEPLNETHLEELRNSLQTYLLAHIRSLQAT